MAVSDEPAIPQLPPADTVRADESTRLHGAGRVVGMALCFGLIVLGLVAFTHSLPGWVATFEHPCSADICSLTPEQARSVLRLGISLRALGMFIAGFYVLFTLITTAIAGLILWRRGDDWMALLVAVALVLYPAVGNVSGDQGAVWNLVAQVIYIVEESLFYLVFALFPNGRLTPRWMVAPVAVWMLLHITSPNLPDWAIGLTYLALYACAIGSLVYKYRRQTSAVQRQQTKWVVFGIVFVLLVNIAYWQPFSFIPALRQPDSLYPVFGFLAYQLLTLAIPLSFGLAILRFRLYDIDIIINRALVYGSLTAILALVYAVGVIGSQSVIGRLTRSSALTQSPLIIVITTLVIVALFQPLRHRLQAAIDRRFYRTKYDAARTLAAFGEALRSEVDLDQLSVHLEDAIENTMRPAFIALWLSPAPTARTPRAAPAAYLATAQAQRAKPAQPEAPALILDSQADQ
jgi:hypothetical protein